MRNDLNMLNQFEFTVKKVDNITVDIINDGHDEFNQVTQDGYGVWITVNRVGYVSTRAERVFVIFVIETVDPRWSGYKPDGVLQLERVHQY